MPILQLQQLNHILQHFAAQLSDRMQQLDERNKHYRERDQTNQMNVNEDLQMEKVYQIIKKYEGYTTSDEGEVQILRKMCEKVLRIFGVYKWKGRSQAALIAIEKQIGYRLNSLVLNAPVDVGKVLESVVQICKRDFILKRCQTPLSISMSINKSRRKIHSKSETRDIKQLSMTPTFGHTQTQILRNKKRTTSMMSYTQIHPTVELIEKLYSGMQIDKVYLSRYIESQSFLTRDQMKRNKSAFKKIENNAIKLEKQFNCHRKIKTEYEGNDGLLNILQEQKTNIKVIGMVSKKNQDFQQKKAPIMSLGVFGKKWCKFKSTNRKRNQEHLKCKDENMII